VKSVIGYLARIPGVRFAAIISPDGVPIACQGRVCDEEGTAGGGELGAAEQAGAFAGLSAGWLNELKRTVDAVTWDAPRRVVLRAQRGTLCMLSVENAIFTVILERGMDAEELRLPMEAAAARLARLLGREHTQENEVARPAAGDSPPGLFPGNGPSPSPRAAPIDRTGRGIPEASRER